MLGRGTGSFAFVSAPCQRVRLGGVFLEWLIGGVARFGNFALALKYPTLKVMLLVNRYHSYLASGPTCLVTRLFLGSLNLQWQKACRMGGPGHVPEAYPHRLSEPDPLVPGWGRQPILSLFRGAASEPCWSWVDANMQLRERRSRREDQMQQGYAI